MDPSLFPSLYAFAVLTWALSFLPLSPQPTLLSLLVHPSLSLIPVPPSSASPSSPWLLIYLLELDRTSLSCLFRSVSIDFPSVSPAPSLPLFLSLSLYPHADPWSLSISISLCLLLPSSPLLCDFLIFFLNSQLHSPSPGSLGSRSHPGTPSPHNSGKRPAIISLSRHEVPIS